MATWIVSNGTADESDLATILLQPEFRKATLNMAMAYASLSQAIKPLLGENLADLGLVLGSNHGEFGATRDFLKALADTGVPRPLLFQNSLHNATIGFLAMKFGLTGPCVTVSNGILTSKNALETAHLLLEQEQCSFCAVTIVDVNVPEARVGKSTSLLLANDVGLTRSVFREPVLLTESALNV